MEFNTNEPTKKTAADSQTWRTALRSPRGEEEDWESVLVVMHTVTLRTDKQCSPTGQHRELRPLTCDGTRRKTV